MESVEAALRAFGEEALREEVQYGKTMSKLDILYLYITTSPTRYLGFEHLVDLLSQYSVNDYAASVRVYAVKPSL